MSRSSRELRSTALNVLLRGRVAEVVRDRDWDLLIEVARLVQGDAPVDLAVTDPFLFRGWRAAVTRFHTAGWTNMTVERIERVRQISGERGRDPSRIDRP